MGRDEAEPQTCELLLAAVAHALLQVGQLVLHLLVLSLRLLALPPVWGEKVREKKKVSQSSGVLLGRCTLGNVVLSPVAVNGDGDYQQHGDDDGGDDDGQGHLVLLLVLDGAHQKFAVSKLDLKQREGSAREAVSTQHPSSQLDVW